MSWSAMTYGRKNCRRKRRLISFPCSGGVVGERVTGCQKKGKGKVKPRVRGHGCYVLIKILPFNYCSEHKGLIEKVLDFLNGMMTQTIRTWRRSTRKPWRSTMDCWPSRNNFWEVEDIITHISTKFCILKMFCLDRLRWKFWLILIVMADDLNMYSSIQY